jgi:RHS repeat-associated protein
MQAMASIRLPDTSMTPPLACLVGEASASSSLFTGKERDAESGNDYFQARYYASGMGRFLTPDKLVITRKRMINPQGWNIYSYARNNPAVLFDPDGKEWQWGGPTSNANGRILVNSMAIAYATSGRFQANFTRVANSKTTIVKMSDANIPDQVGTPSINLGQTFARKDEVQFDAKGKAIGVSSPLHVSEQVDVSKNEIIETSVTEKVKHETEHAAQIDQAPVGYVNAVIAKETGALEHAAVAAEDDSSHGNSVTFGDALDYVTQS